jgi:hypothetical protein
MSTYVREKVLRIPLEKLNLSFTEDEMDDLGWAVEERFGDIWGYGDIGKFQLAPTESYFVDLVLDYEYDACGEYGKTRALYEIEKERYRPMFQKIDPDVNMDFVRLVEFCWYNGCEAEDYYEDTTDDFYDEV